ncbi:DegT/DnrJ/EryC1/StrS aminotransferase family protein [Kiloniella laminariae]|uniref:DegT/DnrJ/EryC1/StrS aminotransferase family protein n=1 Tax=Kiloniella laminariae TaxID=454162 RepID=A0ABT4LHW1_9PROT|nr:DegT/DnrJ/EryC1/StrS aminotransferase family protein [Kiloniella laminariae]MCZ4280515.1 DegT/DnrJ/EryC1/StrS aminotransferase family protein [Kiloniella laminariae]
MLPLFQPDFPSTEELVPFLKRIELSGQYSNFGPLVCEFEKLIAEKFSLSENGVVTASNATAALTEVLRLLVGEKPLDEPAYCLLPAWTFVATAQVVVSAGLIPLFADVDPITGVLTPQIAEEALLCKASRQIRVVLPVAPFGYPVDAREWDEFVTKHKLPVVIDAAASFDKVTPGKVPTIISLHATKSLGIGEGGLVLSGDSDLLVRLKHATSFGFAGSRVASSLGVNAKMSEFHAAVGLAQLKRWPEIRKRLFEVRAWYDDFLYKIDGLSVFHNGETGATSTMNLVSRDYPARKIIDGLERAEVAARIWWEDELYRNQVFGRSCIGKLPVSEYLYHHVFGVPFFSTMTRANVSRVCGELERILDAPARQQLPTGGCAGQ